MDSEVDLHAPGRRYMDTTRSTSRSEGTLCVLGKVSPAPGYPMRVVVKRQMQTIKAMESDDRPGCVGGSRRPGVVRPAGVSPCQASITAPSEPGSPGTPTQNPIWHRCHPIWVLVFLRGRGRLGVSPRPPASTATRPCPPVPGTAACAADGGRKAEPKISDCCRAQAEPGQLGSTTSNVAVAVKPVDRSQRRGRSQQARRARRMTFVFPGPTCLFSGGLGTEYAMRCR